MNELYFLDGNVATLTVYEDHCVIKGKKGLISFMAGRMFDGEKEFYYSDLTSVQYKPASVWLNGFIQFEYPGSQSFSGHDNYNSENSFVIMKGKTDIAKCEEAYKYIKERIAYYKNLKHAPVQNTICAADEILKFKQLLDAGIITQEEFDKKKIEILSK